MSRTHRPLTTTALFDRLFPDIDLFQSLQWDYARRLTSQPLGESFIVEDAADYLWPAPPCMDLGRRRDNDYKDVPEMP